MREMEVKFELGDDDNTPEIGILVDVEGDQATIVLKSGRIVQKPIGEVTVVDAEIKLLLAKIEAKYARLGLEADTNH